MTPARKGDGTGLSFNGYSQVRKGDGTILWSAWSSVEATGGTTHTVTQDGIEYQVHAFTNTGSSTFSVSDPGTGGTVDVLVVGGGGSGGPGIGGDVWGGGGGGGQVLLESKSVVEGDYSLTVGNGGTPPSSTGEVGTTGETSSFDNLTAAGGRYAENGDGGDSGSGLPGGVWNADRSAGGGAGDQEAGGDSADTASETGGDGGDGRDVSAQFGTLYGDPGGWFGGGAAGWDGDSDNAGTAGNGGGGGVMRFTSDADGTPNTGGGGMERQDSGVGGFGGSGIVLVRYPLEDPN